MDKRRKVEYKKYINSPQWKEKRRLLFSAAGLPVCFKCGIWDVPMHVHHLTYARFGGDELMEDLAIVCVPCHEEIHALKHAVKKMRKKWKK
jgi:hypothetical protein